jgi:hypothetical protein
MSTRNGMVLAMLTPFVLATRECAMQMLSNATYVLGESRGRVSAGAG